VAAGGRARAGHGGSGRSTCWQRRVSPRARAAHGRAAVRGHRIGRWRAGVGVGDGDGASGDDAT
jgi:hypothetical protein